MTIACQVKNPSVDLPIGIIGATAIACVLYMLLSLVLCAMIASPKVESPVLGIGLPNHCWMCSALLTIRLYIHVPVPDMYIHVPVPDMLKSGRGCDLHRVLQHLGAPCIATPCSAQQPHAWTDGHGCALCQRLCIAGCFRRWRSLAHAVPADLSPLCVFRSLHR